MNSLFNKGRSVSLLQSVRGVSYEGTDEGVPVKSSDKTICELESLLDQYYYKLVEVKSGSICVSATDVNNS